ELVNSFASLALAGALLDSLAATGLSDDRPPKTPSARSRPTNRTRAATPPPAARSQTGIPRAPLSPGLEVGRETVHCESVPPLMTLSRTVAAMGRPGPVEGMLSRTVAVT